MYSIDMYKPDLVINCSMLASSAQIYEIMRDYNKIKNYVYCIGYLNGLIFEVIKFGESAPSPGTNTSEAIGERVKRQVEHVPGWTDPPYYSSHGNDFWSNLQREIIKSNIKNIDKNDLIIGIWNIDSRADIGIEYLFDSKKELTTWGEGELTRQYKNAYGKKPLLNIKDPTNNRSFKGPLLSKKLFSFN